MRNFEELKADIEAGRSVLIGDEKVTEVARLEAIYKDGAPEDQPAGTLDSSKYAVQGAQIEAVDNSALIAALNATTDALNRHSDLLETAAKPKAGRPAKQEPAADNSGDGNGNGDGE